MYAGFSSRTEGPADFVYDGDMNALKNSFKLDRAEDWKVAYIEVKSTSGPEKYYFHLSEAQFERVHAVYNRC